MQLNIEKEAIERAINETATRAFEKAMAGYEIQQAIANVVTTEVAEGTIAQAIRSAVEKMDTDQLVVRLAEELQKATTRAVVHILQEGLLEVVCKLRGVRDYGDEGRKDREKLRVLLFKPEIRNGQGDPE